MDSESQNTAPHRCGEARCFLHTSTFEASGETGFYLTVTVFGVFAPPQKPGQVKESYCINVTIQDGPRPLLNYYGLLHIQNVHFVLFEMIPYLCSYDIQKWSYGPLPETNKTGIKA